ncbi:MAG: FtsX-like permease family protein [Chlamydiae bacterium]|nr:FtsX-like permease family protein [Chlamydiota bacterium]MBI3266847.1 FtsX-like permease family protein [Chlamydiota bacterium]
MRFIRFILRNIFRSKKRSLLTFLNIAISLFLFCALDCILSTLKNFIHESEQSLVLVVRDKHSTFMNGGVPLAYVDEIRKVPGVLDLSTNLFVIVQPKKEGEEPIFTISIVPQGIDWMRKDFREIPQDERDAFKKTERTVALVGKQVMDRYGWKVGQMVTVDAANVNARMEVKIVGEVPSGIAADNILLHFDYLSEVLGQPGIAHSITLKIASRDMIPRISSAIDKMFENRPVQTETLTEKAAFSDFMSSFGPIEWIIRIISFLVIISSVSITANAIAMSMRERSREVAVLKSLGFTRRLVLSLILSESVTLASLGGTLGSFGAYFFFAFYGVSLRLGPFSYFVVNPATLAVGIAIAMMIGLLSGLVPAFHAAQLSISNTLRRVG